jgi:ABC-type sugar transport system permease subunit
VSVAIAPAAAPRAPRRGGRGRRGRDRIRFALAVAPAVALTVLLLWAPMSQVIGYSFTSFDGFLGVGEFVGIDNYARIANDPGARDAAAHTAIYAVFYIGVQLVLAFLLAVGLTSRARRTGVYRAIYFAPVVVSPVAATFAWAFLFDPNTGSINEALRGIGLGALAQDWLGSFELALYSVIAVDLWKSVGYFVVIFVAGLTTVPAETIEAARVDGAGWLRTLRSITIPQMRLTIGLALVLATNGTLRAFDTAYLLTRGGPGNSTDLYMTKTFREAFTNQDFGYGSALAVVVLVVLILVAAAQRRLSQAEAASR